jgi:glycosyltransferase involved in cell wall biosynthesis
MTSQAKEPARRTEIAALGSDLELRSRLPRVSLVLPNLAGGGAERVTLTLASEFLARGMAVDLVLMKNEGELLDQVPPGARVVDLKTPRTRQVLLAFAQYLSAERPDAVIANMWSLTIACIAARILARSDARLMVCDHVTLTNAYRSWGVGTAFFMRTSIAGVYPFADVRVAVSSGVADDLAALSAIPRGRFDVIHNPITVRPPAAGEDATVNSAWQGWCGKRIISVGTFKTQKNQALLLKAFARASETVDARLMILGEGSLRGDLEALAARLGVAERILMPGFFPDPAPFYRAADLFVLSSDYEGFGNVIVEALACGCPVVSTDCPSGPAEILENGRFGRLTPVGDAEALAAAMSESLAADHDRELLQRRAEDFSPERAADKYLALLFPDGTAAAKPVLVEKTNRPGRGGTDDRSPLTAFNPPMNPVRRTSS